MTEAFAVEREEMVCSLASCCHKSGESPNDGRFPVHPSSQTSSLSWRHKGRKAGVINVTEKALGNRGRSQSGVRGELSGRSTVRTLQHRNSQLSSIAGRDRKYGWRHATISWEPDITAVTETGKKRWTHRCKGDGTIRRGNSESREGLGDKKALRITGKREIAESAGDRRMGS